MRPKLQLLQHVGKVKPRHLDLLAKLCKRPDAPALFDLLYDRDRNLLQFWDTGEAVVLTQITTAPAGPSLLVYGVTGRAIIKNMAEVVADLRTIAREYGCRSVSGRPTRSGWNRAGLEALGFRPENDLMVLEI